MSSCCVPWKAQGDENEEQLENDSWDDISSMWRPEAGRVVAPEAHPQIVPSHLAPPAKTVEMIGDGPPQITEATGPLPKLEGVRADVEPALTEGLISHLLTVLPEECKIESSWTLLFSTLQHGTSYNTLCSRLSGEEHVLFLVRTESGGILGTYIAHAVNSGNKRGYQGGGNNFVFAHNCKFGHYPWTQKNRYHVCFKPEGFGFGGDPNFALWVDSSLGHGSTGFSKTYANPALAMATEGEEKVDFNIFNVEVWKCGPAGSVAFVHDHVLSTEEVGDAKREAYDSYGYGGSSADVGQFTDPLQVLQAEFADLPPEIVQEVFGEMGGDEARVRATLLEFGGGSSTGAGAEGEPCPVCGAAVPAHALQDHVNSHFD